MFHHHKSCFSLEILCANKISLILKLLNGVFYVFFWIFPHSLVTEMLLGNKIIRIAFNCLSVSSDTERKAKNDFFFFSCWQFQGNLWNILWSKKQQWKDIWASENYTTMSLSVELKTSDEIRKVSLLLFVVQLTIYNFNYHLISSSADTAPSQSSWKIFKTLSKKFPSFDELRWVVMEEI